MPGGGSNLRGLAFGNHKVQGMKTLQRNPFLADESLKATYKRRVLGDIAPIVAAAPSMAEAARLLGVHKSSVSRWVKLGIVPKPTSGRGRAPASPPPESPVAWAGSVRRDYDLTANEQVLVDLATATLTLAQDMRARPADRLSAMGRFQSITRQLGLEDS
jgi:transposase-like protein